MATTMAKDPAASIHVRLEAARDDLAVKDAQARAARELRDELIIEADQLGARPCEVAPSAGVSTSRVVRIIAGV